jgi:hypothetical protein
MMSTPRFRVAHYAFAAVALFPLCAPAALDAQGPSVYFACYVPLTGTVYRIKEGNLKTACTTGHVEFSWTDGANAVRATDPAGGDLSGVFSNATVIRLLGRALSNTPPQTGEVLMWNGTSWSPAPAPSGGNPVLGGDVSGPSNAAAVVGLRGHPISPNPPQFGTFLRFDGSGWNGAATVDHSELGRLSSDDHPQYLLSDGVRSSVNGFAVTGTLGSGTIPVHGQGVRLMWYPGKAAFRAGAVNSEWNDANIGEGSVAFGLETVASGRRSTALGENTQASGRASFAVGLSSAATADGTTAMGNQAISRHLGSFVYSDASTFLEGTLSSRANQFAVRAQHFWFGSTSGGVVSSPAGEFITTSTGAFLSTGGAWTNASDIALKNAFTDIDADDVLNKIAHLPIRSWSYKAEDPTVRHVGPSAQDFRTAFGLGNAETSIATVDADGISLLGIQALEKRTRELQRDNHKLRALNTDLLMRLERLEAALSRLENAKEK